MPIRSWWVVLLGVFPVHVAVQLQSGVPILLILFWFISNAAEALIGAICLRRFVERQADFAGLKNLAILPRCGDSRAVSGLLYRCVIRLARRLEGKYLLANLADALSIECSSRPHDSSPRYPMV
jgi:hypothetical protein